MRITMKTILFSTILIAALSTPTWAQSESSEAPSASASTQEEAAPTPEATPTAEQGEKPTTWPRNLWGVYGGIGLPHGLSGGLEFLHQSKRWSTAIEFGAFGYKPDDEDKDSKDEFGLGSFEVTGRYHPTAGSFYVAASLGKQGVFARRTQTFLSEEVTPEVTLDNTFASPKFGWFWQFNSGINFGVELGAQVPLTTDVKIKDGTTNPLILNDPEYIKIKKDVNDLAERLGKQVLPVALVRFGYAF